MTDLLTAIRKHHRLALGIARAWRRRLPPNVLAEDVEQAALIGLFEWKKAHPDESSPGWMGGLMMRINGSIKDELRRQDWLPRRRRDAERRGDGPVRVVGCDDADMDWEAHWASSVESPEEVVARKLDAAEALRAPLKSKDEQVVRLAYFRGVMLKDVAFELDCSEPRVSQRHSRAMGVMRAHLTGEGRRPERAKRNQSEEQHGGDEVDFDCPQSGIYPKGVVAVTSTLPEHGVNLRAELALYQQWMIDQALIRAQGNKERAARLLGLERTSFVNMLKRSSPPRATRSPEPEAPASAPHPAHEKIAALWREGQHPKSVASRLGLNYWVVEREFRLLAAAAASEATQEVGS